VSAAAAKPLAAYGLIADGHTAALVSDAGSIDWCCLPRLDSSSCFAALLDAERGGACAIAPAGPFTASRAYEPDTLVLVTTFRTDAGTVRVTDAFLLDGDQRELLRVVEGEIGAVELDVRVAPRFDYGAVRPWIRRAGERHWCAIGGDDALSIGGDVELERDAEHELSARVTVREGERARLWLGYAAPQTVDRDAPPPPGAAELDDRLEATRRSWRAWSEQGHVSDAAGGVLRSALALKALAYPPTGAIAAAATTSLPEAIGGTRNWDYRYSWIRDSSYAARSLAEVGFEAEADAFRRFVQRSAAGHASELQVLFGVGGERRLAEQELELAGYRGSRPVRTGNGAAGQLQLDAYGEIVGLTWRWHQRGHSPDDDFWRFLATVIDTAAERWPEPDAGLWEWRGDPLHFVHSKALCWGALDRGIRLADECGRRAPVERWARARAEVAAAIESEGYDGERGVYRQAFGRDELDGALLLLPVCGYLAWDDPRMVRTTDAVRSELDAGNGLLYRYRRDDGLDGDEGAFLACSFWLAECLARQGRAAEARAAFDATAATANDLGLFSEEWDPVAGEMLGNLPQALTHLAHIAAAVALDDHGYEPGRPAANPAR
jgi:GH15 family glucan-1,4-alpha-glucosidase